MTDLPVNFKDIRDAAVAIAGAVARTPATAAPALSELTGIDICLKLETLHRTGSFKERGALTKLLTLKARERSAGVVAMSAGNHAQGVAYHAQRLGIPATIVMPEGTPFIKIDRTEAFGAKVVLKGDSLSAAREAADALARDEGLVFVHPYDDPAIIAGQGTIALELLKDRPDLDMLVVPIGGGGLISGVAVAAKAVNPRIEIIGVQSTLYPSMYRLMRGEDPGPPAAAATLAEGIAVKEPGQLTRRIVAALVSDILLVDDVAIEAAIEALIERQKLVVEGAGAAGLAAILTAPERLRGRRVGIVISGATSMRACSLRSSCAAWCGRAGSCGCARNCPIFPVPSHASPGWSASTPATSSRCITNACSTTPRSNAPSSMLSSRPRTGAMSRC